MGVADQNDEKVEGASFRTDLPRFNSRVSVVGCGRALASITWLWHKKTGESHLLFATLDLVPDELPLSDCAPKRPPVSLGKKSDWWIYSANDEVPSSQAVEWYDGLVTRGAWAATWLNPEIKKPTALGDLLNEPRWPAMVNLRHHRTAVPFATQRPDEIRAHHTLSKAGAAMKLLEPEEKVALFAAMKASLDLDLERGQHLCQSAHVFMPLPILRHVSSRLDSDEKVGDRAINLNLVPRVGASLEMLTVEILETRATGDRLLARGPATSMFLRVPLDEEVEQISIRVVHDELGLLVDEGPYAFIRGISMEMQLITSDRRIVLPARGSRPAETHKIPIAGMTEKTITGSERGVSASQVLYRAATGSSKVAALAKQMWFRDKAPAAEAAIRKLIGAAKERVLLIDPYFTKVEATLYLPWVTRSTAKNEILTSSHGLRQISPSIEENEGQESKVGRRVKRELAHLQALSTELNDGLAARRINPTVVKVMTGSRPPVHDRFLIIDGNIWLLGSSLNNFGTRGTMMVELPAPMAVMPDLVALWVSDTSKEMSQRIDFLSRQLAATT